MITRSQGPMPSVVVPACSRTVRSPLAPSTRRPCFAIASAWSGHSVTACTSWPALAISAAYTEPMAPQPMIATFDMSFLHGFGPAPGAGSAAQ
jgi:hypothetical protein